MNINDCAALHGKEFGIKLMREMLAEAQARPDRVYRARVNGKLEMGGDCRYDRGFHDTEPCLENGCIVGRGLVRLGVTEGLAVGALASKLLSGYIFPPIDGIIQRAQNAQDFGDTWSEAVKEISKFLENQKIPENS